MAIPVRRHAANDAIWARAWTAATASDLSLISGPAHGDVAYVTDEAAYRTWRDDGTWEAPAASGVETFNTRSGAVTLSSGDVTGALTFTPYNATNPSGFISSITGSDVTTALGYTPTSITGLTGAQSASAIKTGLVLVKADVGLGSVEDKSSATIRGEITSLNVTGALTYTPTSVTGLTGVQSAAALKTGLLLTKADVGLSSVEDKSSATIRGEITSGNVTTALTYTPTSVTGLTGAQSVAAFKTGLVLAKADVGLGSVEDKSSATIRGELTSGNVTTALTFTPLDAASASFAGSAAKLTTGRTITLTGDTTGVSVAFDGSGALSFATVGVQAAKWTTARTLSFTGDATGSGSVDGSAGVATGLTLATVNANTGSFGTANAIPSFTVNGKGLITAAGSNAVGLAATATALATGRTIAITGDIAYTSPSFDGTGNVTAAGTLATVNANAGSFGTGTQVGTFTVNGKGLITAASNTAILSAPKWATARNLSFTTDVTGTGSVDGSGDVATALTIAANAVTTTKIINSAVTLAKIANAAANSKLLGSGASGSGAAYAELTVGTGLAMVGTTLSAFTALLIMSGTVTTGANVNNNNLTGVVFNYEANSTYLIDFYGTVNAAANTTGYGFNLDTSTAVTANNLTVISQLANTGTLTGSSAIADAANVGVATGTPTNATDVPVFGMGLLVTGANTGTCQFIVRSETTAAITCNRAIARIQKVA